MRTHYPRTPHLPWSPGATPDDVRVAGLAGLVGREVVVTEKLDGENTTLYRDGLHARSLDSGHHPSRAWVKALHGRIAHAIPAGWRVCGENLFARHSLGYDGLASWFYAFSVWSGDECLDWDSTVRFTRRLGLPTPPVVWRGAFDERRIRALRVDPARQEGYVVRTVAGFDRADFAGRVAKWVRPRHVSTDQHWMYAPVVPNGRGATAALWDVRSGAEPDVPALVGATGVPSTADPRAAPAGLDLIGRTGDARLAGVLATLYHDTRRPWLAAKLTGPLGLPLARRVADLVGLHTRLHRPFPDDGRRAGLVRLATAVDVGVLHAVATATAPSDEAREQVEWSAAHADDAGLRDQAPLAGLRAGLRVELSDVDDADARDRCWVQTWPAYAEGRIGTAPEASALTWRWRGGAFPRLVVMVGPAGSGKSTFVAGLAGVDEVVSLDDLRVARGSRADQRGNAEVLTAGLATLERALTGSRRVVWDATCLNPPQRALVHAVARRRDALITHAVTLADPEILAERNASRAHPVPAKVLATHLQRFAPPYPGEAHRIWYVGPDAAVGDVAGGIDSEDP